MNEESSKQREIDASVEKTLESVKSRYRIIPVMEIKAWKAYLIVFFVAGFASALILSAYNSWFVGLNALTGPAIFTQTTDESHRAGESFATQIFLDSASQNINAVQIIATFDPAFVSISSIDTSSSDFPNEAFKEVNTSSNKITIALAKQTPGVNSSRAGIAAININTLKDFSGSGITLKFRTTDAIDDCAAIADDGRGTNVLSYISVKFTNLAQASLPVDITAPLRSGGFPSGTLSAGINSTTLEITTNENAICKYATAANIPYISMEKTFSTTNSSNHLTAISGLVSGKAYAYYIKCQDTFANVNTDDYVISFFVAGLNELYNSVSLAASPSSGPAPLNGVSLSATVSGTSLGNINYFFYCDRQDIDTNITADYVVKYGNQTEITKTANTICSYERAGTYYPKVIIERGSAKAAETRAKIIVLSDSGLSSPLDQTIPVSPVKGIDSPVWQSIPVSLWKGSDSSVWVIQNNLKSLIRSIDVFDKSGYNWAQVQSVSDDSLNAVPVASLIKTVDNPDVYRLEKNFKRKLASTEIFDSYSLDWNKISAISQPMMDSFSYAPIYQHNNDLFWRDSRNILHRFTTMQVFSAKGYNIRDLILVNDIEYGSFAVGEEIRD